jgi:nucleoside-diphosphate-sugar epimerase
MKNEDIELYDGGKVIRDYMHVSDMCRAINLIIRKAKTNQIINVGSGKYYSMLELIQYAKDKIKSSSQISFVESSDFHKIVGMEDMILNVDKLKELEFEPCFSIWDSIDELFKR